MVNKMVRLMTNAAAKSYVCMHAFVRTICMCVSLREAGRRNTHMKWGRKQVKMAGTHKWAACAKAHEDEGVRETEGLGLLGVSGKLQWQKTGSTKIYGLAKKQLPNL